MQSSLERKINRLVFHRNANAASVPLGTSVCVVLDHSGLSVQLWTHDKWPHCLSTFNNYILCQICSVHLYTYLCSTNIFTTHLHKSVHTFIPCSHAHTHTTVDLSCVMETGVRYCVMCVGVISLGKRTKDLTGAATGPTITAWNLTAVKEPSVWQEENWAPVSDSTDQNLFCGHKDGQDC